MLRLFLLLSLLTGLSHAHTDRTVVTAAGDEIPIRVHGSGGERILLWLPSEFGPTPRRTALAQALSGRSIEVWEADLHAAWFLPTGRYSLNDVDPAAVAGLIGEAVGTGRPVFLMAEGRTAALALNAVRHWQSHSDATRALRGLLTFNPRLFVRTPQGAESAEYLPVAGATNLPVYLLQPEESSGFWHVARDVAELERGGSPVFLHRLPGVSDGFHARPDFSDEEEAMTRRLPSILDQAMQQLAALEGTPPEPAPIYGDMLAPERPDRETLLRPFEGKRLAPALRLPTLRGAPVDLAALRGKVVLVNFWATWCPPCVEEIPSLQRLYRRLAPHGLEILAVDVGEPVETMEAFLKDKPIDFPVLMDTDGEALRRWGVYAFPTTLVVDREQRIRYAVFGAFDWSSGEVFDALTPLLGIPAAVAR